MFYFTKYFEKPFRSWLESSSVLQQINNTGRKIKIENFDLIKDFTEKNRHVRDESDAKKKRFL